MSQQTEAAPIKFQVFIYLFIFVLSNFFGHPLHILNSSDLFFIGFVLQLYMDFKGPPRNPPTGNLNAATSNPLHAGGNDFRAMSPNIPQVPFFQRFPPMGNQMPYLFPHPSFIHLQGRRTPLPPTLFLHLQARHTNLSPTSFLTPPLTLRKTLKNVRHRAIQTNQETERQGQENGNC
jgi:hypothetical protein